MSSIIDAMYKIVIDSWPGIIGGSMFSDQGDWDPRRLLPKNNCTRSDDEPQPSTTRTRV